MLLLPRYLESLILLIACCYELADMLGCAPPRGVFAYEKLPWLFTYLLPFIYAFGPPFSLKPNCGG